MKYKAGDRVESKQPYHSYIGTIISFDEQEGVAKVRRDGNSIYDSWSCKILPNGELATAYGSWDKKSKLILLESEFPMKNANYGVKYDRDSDPVEFFETKQKAQKRIEELLDDSSVNKTSIVLFEVGKKWEVNRPVSYELVLVK